MNWLAVLPLFCVGLVYGLLIGVLNHLFLSCSWQKIDLEHIERAKRRLMIRYAIHYFIYFIALFLVYRQVPILLGAGLGMVLIPKFLAIKYIITDKGVK